MFITLIAAAALVALLERIPRMRFRSLRFFWSRFVTDLFYLLTGFVAGGHLPSPLSLVGHNSWATGYLFRVFASLSPPLSLSVVLALLALDAGNYAAHYCLHRFVSLWKFHEIHHSSLELDWLATFRSHIVEQLLRRLVAPVLLMLVGFPQNAVMIAGAGFIAWSIFNHANIRLKLHTLEGIFITPRLHRIHHPNDGPTRNPGTIFTFWDKLRDTLDRTEFADESWLGNGEPDYPQVWLCQFYAPIIRISVEPRFALVTQR
jgi:sterol desaturase/sphingolipid hydroxylase (fatty acid hydroxylase superfamily)